MSISGLKESKFILDTEASRGGVSRPDWSRFVSSGLISEGDVNSIRVFEGQDPETFGELLNSGSNGKDYGSGLLAVLDGISDAAVLKYTLGAIEDVLLPDVLGRGKIMFSDGDIDLLTSPENDTNFNNGPKFKIAPFVKLANHDDALVRSRAIYLVSLLLGFSGVYEDQDSYVRTIVNEVYNMVNPECGLAQYQTGVQALSVLLRNREIRELFNQKGGVLILINLLDKSFKSMGRDTQYMSILCLWLLCFSPNAASLMDQAALSVLVGIMKTEPLIRVVRLCLSTIRVVLENEATQKMFCEALIENCKLPKVLANISDKKKEADKELKEDIEWIEETLSRNFTVLTTFERHEQDLLSKKLRWSMVHEEMFWKENSHKFESNNFSSVRKLIDLLDSEDPQTVAIACSDIGYFVQYFPNGKMIVDGFGGKTKIMELLSHDKPEVQKQALSACSKIMVTNWESFH